MADGRTTIVSCVRKFVRRSRPFCQSDCVSIPKMYDYKSSNIPDWRSLLDGPLEDEEAPRVLLDGISSLPLLALQLFDDGYDLVGLLKRVLHSGNRKVALSVVRSNRKDTYLRERLTTADMSSWYIEWTSTFSTSTTRPHPPFPIHIISFYILPSISSINTTRPPLHSPK